MIRTMMGLLLLAGSGVALAEKPTAHVGESTQSWLELQRDGEQASEQASLIPGDVAHRAYQRYLNSFQHPIPEQYPRAGFRRDE